MEDKLIAKGIDIYGKEHKFDCKGGELRGSHSHLVSLTVPKGVDWVYCSSNQLTELILPEGVNDVYCFDNQFTELILPEGVTDVYCWNNQLTELKLPSSVKRLWADKKVTGLEKYIGTDVEIILC